MPYPGRRRHDVLPEFVGTAVIKPTPAQRVQLLEFCAEQYEAGRSIHELAELTGRSQNAVRRALDAAGVLRRGRGAPELEVTKYPRR